MATEWMSSPKTLICDSEETLPLIYDTCMYHFENNKLRYDKITTTSTLLVIDTFCSIDLV
jgi:hypothetical protein